MSGSDGHKLWLSKAPPSKGTVNNCMFHASLYDGSSRIDVGAIGENKTKFAEIKQWIQQFEGWTGVFQTADRTYTLTACMPLADAIAAKLRWGVA